MKQLRTDSLKYGRKGGTGRREEGRREGVRTTLWETEIATIKVFLVWGSAIVQYM